MKAFILAIFLVLATTAVMAKPGSGNFGSQISAAQCDPSGGKLVLNIVFQVTGDADSGFGGYWAIDSYMKHIQAWDMGSGRFCLDVKYTGSFVTVAGTSPNKDGVVADGVTGTMDGGYTMTLFGTFTPGTKRTKGNIGSKDYGCVITSGNAIGCTYYSFLSDYFSSVTYFNQDFWGWTYRAGTNGTWVNSIDANTGDITGNP